MSRKTDEQVKKALLREIRQLKNRGNRKLNNKLVHLEKMLGA